MAGKDGGVTSFGAGWPGDVLRRLVGARGKWSPPDRFADFVQPTAELRPQLPWEFWQARWVRGALSGSPAAVAGQFATADFTLPANTGRYALLQGFETYNPGTAIALYVNRALINPTRGAGVLDARAVSSGGSWLTPMVTGLATGALGGLPAIADRVWVIPQLSAPQAKVPPIFLAPGTTVTFVALTVNVNYDISCEVWELPQPDVDG